MRASRGQIKIQQILTASGLDFQEEYSFPDLIGPHGWPLRFDFCIFNDDKSIDFLIELQGEQHYQPKEKFGGLNGLRKQQFNDMKKREYCKKHNLNLVIIPYWDLGRVNYDYIMTAAGY